MEDENITLSIAGGLIKKATSAIYLGMTMTSEGDINENRGNSTLQRAGILATAARLGDLNQRHRANYFLETHLRRLYTYNAFLLPYIDKLKK